MRLSTRTPKVAGVGGDLVVTLRLGEEGEWGLTLGEEELGSSR